MSNELLSNRLRHAVKRIEEKCVKRAEVEERLKSEYQLRQDAAHEEYTVETQRIEDEYSQTQDQAVRTFQETTEKLKSEFETEHSRISTEFEKKQTQVDSEFEESRDELQIILDENIWTIETIFEADKRVAKEELVKRQKEVGTAIQAIDACHKQVSVLSQCWRLERLAETVAVAPDHSSRFADAYSGLEQSVQAHETCLKQLKRLYAPKLLRGFRLELLFLAFWLLLLIPAWWMNEWYLWVGTTLLAVVSIDVIVRFLLRHNLCTRYVGIVQAAKQAMADSEPLQKRALEDATTRYHDQQKQAKEKKDRALNIANTGFNESVAELTKKKNTDLSKLNATYRPQLDRLQLNRDTGLKNAESLYQQAMSESTNRYEDGITKVTKRRDETLKRSEQVFRNSWDQLVKKWDRAVRRFSATLSRIQRECRHFFPDWPEVLDEQWQAANSVPPGMRFGELEIGLKHLPCGIPNDPSLCEHLPEPANVPALTRFPQNGSLLIKAADEGRAHAIQLMQAVMLRYLTSIPPAKVRFTIIDPVGLGEHFAAFTHLSDFDEKLVTSRIWTEPGHIEQRLADLTEHIENVIQKYLRNQFETLEEYNAQAGEVAEPYRLLVISHFPVNFTEEAARRLLSISASGARCGIQTLILVDTNQALPRNFSLTDLERDKSILAWDGSAFQWNDPDFSKFPLQLDAPPPADEVTPILQIMGEKARKAARVEVPFEVISPVRAKWWTESTKSGIRVPLGKAGATRKQLLDLGHGTAQHVLIAGKTGSGKSTLLHSLIVQLALRYSPDEIELYLIDFKKGVEFKTYANHELPHARVVAIESEREFGLSVLQRLDAELKERGERFRAAGVQDLPSYREVSSDPLPRILLVVDEFQEFFVDDDRVAQESALLLDRLVRQGRAFGIHILLGSQTLGGAYSLARSTIDQMAIRIALQCSETDGHLILSKENSAARLLSRPGEAIYNHANGLVEGNNLFQVVWLSDDKRDQYLSDITKLATNGTTSRRPQIVFEGNAPAHLEKNPKLQALLQGNAASDSDNTIPVWLGESIAIKDPTAAVFQRQSGCNLLLVGQHPESALSIMTSAVISLGLQLPPEQREAVPAPLVLFSNSVSDDRSSESFQTLARVFPKHVHIADWSETRDIIGKIANEVNRRLETRTEPCPPIFLFIYGLQHFRDLRRSEDDFGFSRRDENKPIPPPKQFTTILREGPMLGVFTIVWCDTLNNLNRTFDRQTLREFEMRVLFQMNANDSSNLIDSPLASRLGLYRALFYSEDQGQLEKFRPYGFPSHEWLSSLKNHPIATPVAGDE